MRRSSDRLIWSGLLLLSEALSFEVDAVCIVDEAIEDCVGDGGIQPLRYLHDCSDCFRLERLPGGIFTHWKAPPLHGAHPERSSPSLFSLDQPCDKLAPCPGVSEGVMAVPETRYAKSGNVHIAYQVFGSGPNDLVFVPGFISHLENYWEHPDLARWLLR